ncbi:hypothetical protein ABID97_003650 [Variovorax sp. OAS795]|uniref:hypothetical protein n=1 Tax=Variovorax sp. OAS795 TaxID=3034231 RepID=UPI00339244D2
MKYIVAKIDNEEVVFVFPRTVDHDRMAEALERIRFGGDRNWERKLHSTNEGAIISAGFVDNGTCHGNSETLKLKSRGAVDSKLLRVALTS